MNLRFSSTPAVLRVFVGLALSAHALRAAPILQDTEFATAATPLFQEFCFKCHSDKKAKGNLNLQQLSSGARIWLLSSKPGTE
jgi:hypothetical protein